MKEIHRSQWNYILYEKDGNLMFSVICGTIGVFEVNILLNGEEVDNFKQKGEDYLKELAEKIRYSPKSFNDRHVDFEKLGAMIDSKNIIKLLEGLEPSKYELLSKVSGLVNDNMLRKIAEADYGYKADECFQELLKIRESKTTPGEIDFALQEVLELTRWSEPTNKEEHITRFYSSLLLIILYPNLKIHVNNENETLAVFIEDVLELGPSYYQPALQLISWRTLLDYQDELKAVLEDDGDEEDVFLDPVLKYTLLLLMTLNNKPQEITERLQHWLFTPEDVGILVDTIESGQRSETWLSISKRIVPNQDIVEPKNINTALKQLLTCIIHKQ